MTGHTSDEVLDQPQEQRSTDSESALQIPKHNRGGVVQDSPGNPDIGTDLVVTEPGGQIPQREDDPEDMTERTPGNS